MGIEPCKAGFEYCDEMRAEDVRKHPRTPRYRECRHMPIPPERPERLQGPEIGTECIYNSASERFNGRRVVVIERSYVWGPGDASYGGGARHYDWKVIRFLDDGRTLCVDDKDLTPVGL